ncbi:histone H3.v1-like [Numida meleagris]|uniref:histone H3.v1-like n=1 Tax=Numida meleagris TaxID=8996 RepID=UPI000B3D8D13|nr:histone H3.v1-like [Numida meleagris]
MEERPPSRLRVAWEKSGAPQERRPPPEPYEVTEVQPLHADADWLPVYEEEENEEEKDEEEEKEEEEEEEEKDKEEAKEIIEDFLSFTEEEEMRKMTFLERICTICRNRKKRGLSESLAVFSREKNLVAKVKELLENEPTDQLCTAVRYQAVLAIAALRYQPSPWFCQRIPRAQSWWSGP